MNKIRDLLRLKFDSHLSHRDIASMLTSTVPVVLDHATTLNFRFSDDHLTARPFKDLCA